MVKFVAKTNFALVLNFQLTNADAGGGGASHSEANSKIAWTLTTCKKPKGSDFIHFLQQFYS